MSNPIYLNYVAVGVQGNGNLYVIGVATTYELYGWYQDVSDGTWYFDGLICGGDVTLSSCATIKGYEGGLDIVGVQLNDTPYTLWQYSTGGWDCESGTSLGDMQLYPFVVSPGWNGSLQALAIGIDDNLPYLFQSLGSTYWVEVGVLCSFNQTFSACTLGTGYNNNLNAILVDANSGLLYAVWQDSTTGNWTCPGVPLGGDVPIASLAAGVGYYGNLYVVGIAAQDGLPRGPLYLWSQSVKSGEWSYEGQLCDSNAVFVTTAVGYGGDLQVIFIGEDQLPYVIWQDSNTGDWNCPTSPLLNTTQQLISVATGIGVDGYLYLIGLSYQSPGSLPYVWWQDTTSGKWHYEGMLESLVGTSEPSAS